MAGPDGHEMGSPPATLPSPLPGQGTWIGDELQRAQQRIESLTREITLLNHSLKAQQEETARLVETLQVVDGRTLRREAGETVLRVGDDGIGFDPEILDSRVSEGHIGLASLVVAVDSTGGSVDFGTGPDGGSVVTVRVPDVLLDDRV